MLETTQWKLAVVGSAAALIMGVGAVWGFGQMGTAFAQTGEGTGEVQQGGDSLELTRFGRGSGPGAGMVEGRFGGGQEFLANALGITEAELETARQAAHDAALEQAVADGLLTQEQADQMQEGRGRGFARLIGDVDHDALLAEALGISVDELEAAKDNMIDAAVEAGLLTEAQGNDLTLRKMIREGMTAARESALREAVEAGLITQAQADNLPDGRDSGMRGFGRQGHGSRFDGRGGHSFNQNLERGSRDGGFRFNDSQSEIPETEIPGADVPVIPSSNL